MKWTGTLVTTARGSIGGVTASSNKGGQYFRRRSIPTNPNTAAQQARRASVSTLATGWKLLSQTVQDDWADYAAGTPVTDALGNTIYLTGFQWYVGLNSLRLMAGQAIQMGAPGSLGLAVLTQPTSVAISAATQFLTATLSDSDPWTDNGDGRLHIQISRPLSPGVNSVKQAFRYAGSTPGQTANPVSATGNIPVPFVLVQGDKVAVRFTAQDGTLRRSEPITVLVTVGA